MERALVVILLCLVEQVVVLSVDRRNHADVGDAEDSTIGHASHDGFLHLCPRTDVEQIGIGTCIEHAKRIVNRPDAAGRVAHADVVFIGRDEGLRIFVDEDGVVRTVAVGIDPLSLPLQLGL